MNKTVYAILCEEPEVDPYVLGDGFTDLETAQQVMAHRGEEFIDEMVSMNAEMEIDDRPPVLKLAEDRMSVRVFTKPLNENCLGYDHIKMRITAISVEL